METGSNDSPTPRQARESLQQVTNDESAVRYPPLPRWFFPTMAVLVGLLFLARMLEPRVADSITAAVAVVAILLGVRYWLHRDGVSWVKLKISDMALFMTAILGSFAACWVVSETMDARWVWIAGALVAGGVVVATGRRYRQEFGDET